MIDPLVGALMFSLNLKVSDTFSIHPHKTGRLAPTITGSYAVTKYGVKAFSDALRREMDPWGMKDSIIEPGGFQTQIASRSRVEKQMQQGWDDLSEQLKNEYTEKGKKLNFSNPAS